MVVRARDQVTLVLLPAPTYVRQYYVLQASALAAPALPTANPPAAPWTATEPTYTAGSTNTLYTTLLTAYGSITFDYGAVQVSSTYEAAKAAMNKAVTVETTANGKSAVIRSSADPVNPPAATYTQGDMWWKFIGTTVINMWVHDGTNWVAQSLTGSTITNLNAGVISAGIISADRIDATTLQGKVIQTAASGKRVVIDGPNNTLNFYGDTIDNEASSASVYGYHDGGAAGSSLIIATGLQSNYFGHTNLPVSGSVEVKMPTAWVEDLVISSMTDDLNNTLFGPDGIINSSLKIRLKGAGEVDIGEAYADTAPFMIGDPSSGLNIVMDTNELQARSLTAAASININTNGGNVNLGSSSFAGTVSIEGRAMTDSGWINCSRVNSWGAVTGLTPQYRKLNGVVYLRGRATGGTTNTVFTLPLGYRPGTADIVALVQNGATAGSTTRIVVDAGTGAVSALSGSQPNFEMCFPDN